MSKTQFWILNYLGVILTTMLLGHYFFARSNNRLGEATRREQASISESRRLEVVLDQLVRRVAVGSEVEPKLKDILVRYGLSVELEKDGKKKKYP